MKKILVVLFMMVCLLPATHGQLLEKILTEANLHAKPTTKFVPPLQNKTSSARDKQDQQLYAFAQYLFNMYLYNKKGDLPSDIPLSLIHIGALDPLYQLKKPLLPSDAKTWFYNEQDSNQIYNYLNQFLREKNMPAVLFNPQRVEQDYLRLANTFFFQDGYPSYAKPTVFNWKTEISDEDKRLLLPLWQVANQYAQNRVVVFEQKPELNIDNPRVRNHPTYTYRWVKDECEYNSYVIAKELFQAQARSNTLAQSRIYKITARDKQSGLLKPNSSTVRFKLANGTQSSQWQYHTATLILLATPEKQQYKPIVLDNFLGGTTLMSLEEWVDRFADSTYFQVIPFQTKKAYDQAIAPVEERRGRNVIANGHTCTPHPIHE